MSEQWDFTGYDRHGQLVLAVGVKTLPDVSKEWAADYRRNLLTHGMFPNPPYLLLVFPDTLYLWKNIETQTETVSPTYTIDARPIFDPYFDQLNLDDGWVDGYTFNLIVGSWLQRLFRPEIKSNGGRNTQTRNHWFVETGLAETLKGGRLEYSKELA